MNNIVVMPMIIPLLTGVLLVFLRPYVKIQRVFSLVSIAVTIVVSIYILNMIQAAGFYGSTLGAGCHHLEFHLSRTHSPCCSY